MGKVHPCHSSSLWLPPPRKKSVHIITFPTPLNRNPKHSRAQTSSSLTRFCQIRFLIPIPKLAGIHSFIFFDLMQEFKVRSPSSQASTTSTDYKLPWAWMWSKGKFFPCLRQISDCIEGSLLKRTVSSSACVSRSEKEEKSLFGAMQRACPRSQGDQKARLKGVNDFKCIQMTTV